METRQSAVLARTAVVSADGADGAVVHGVAIGEGDVTHGMSGNRLVWPREALLTAVDELDGVSRSRAIIQALSVALTALSTTRNHRSRVWLGR